MEKVDLLDLKILKIISVNARIPFKDVAAACGVSRAAIHQRVQRLIQAGVITGSGGWGTVFYGTQGIVAVNRGKLAVWQTPGVVKPTLEVRKALENMSFTGGKVVAASVGKDYGTDSAAKVDNALGKAIDTLVAKYGLETAPVQLYKCENQVKNFCECIETRKPTISPASIGGRSGTLCLLCNMSYQYDTGFCWDPEKMDFADCKAKKLPLARADSRGWDIVV